MTINYISNLSLKESSGGGSGVNYAIFHELAGKAKLNYIGPIVVPTERHLHYVSKMKRLLGAKGDYFFYSKNRLNRIKSIVEAEISQINADVNFFNGITPWINVHSHMPYFAYSDACFHTYINIFNRANEFSNRDKERLFELEATWMKKATKIFFRSKWALEETIKAYGISGNNFSVAGLGGFITIPETIQLEKNRNLLFISKEFIAKGGISCFKAFQIVKQHFPEFQLTIIGQRPPEQIMREDGVRYVGVLNKNNEQDMQIFSEIVAHSFLLVHPTKKDTNALVLAEAGYFGCPAITVNSFAIPEFVLDGKTGYLVGNADDYEGIADKILFLIRNKALYNEFVLSARKYTTSNFTWRRVGEFIYNQICESVE